MYIQTGLVDNHMPKAPANFEEDRRWSAVLTRDASQDGVFVYAVRSTGVFCRPTCPSRGPLRTNVEFYDSPDAAESAGYRACLRCKPKETNPQVELANRIRQLIEQDGSGVYDLETLAREVGVSAHHLQRTFKKVVGISPRAYTEAWRMAEFRKEMKQGSDVTTALYAAGFGSSSRLYEKSAAQLGMTPGDYGRGGKSMKIDYAIVESPLGLLMIAGTENGLCSVTLGDDEAALESTLQAEFSEAEINRDQSTLQPAIDSIVEHLNGRMPHLELPLDVRATAFQRMVWEELQKIPYGEVRSYSEVATALGRPTAVRAVARACATNPVALIVPCHRVVREGGALGGYRWGLTRKARLLEIEKNEKDQVSQ